MGVERTPEGAKIQMEIEQASVEAKSQMGVERTLEAGRKCGTLRILMILTGGTIGTMVGADGKRRLPSEKAEPILLTSLRKREPDLGFEVKVCTPYEVLSEHMTLKHLERLADCLRGEDLTRFDGILITHGSDTLAFTATFLGELMRGCPIPVFLLATQRPIEEPESNGVENTRAAFYLLMHSVAAASVCKGEDGSSSLVFVTYRNSDGVMYLHRAEELRQCQPGTEDFFSVGMKALKKSEDGRYDWPAETVRETETDVNASVGAWCVPDISLAPDVLLLHPYVGIRYDCISLSGIRAVLHTLYHSSTAPKELAGFLDRCREAGVPCYILPCDPENFHYETTAELLEHGAVPVSGMSEERAYMKLILGRNPA